MYLSLSLFVTIFIDWQCSYLIVFILHAIVALHPRRSKHEANSQKEMDCMRKSKGCRRKEGGCGHASPQPTEDWVFDRTVRTYININRYVYIYIKSINK